MVSSPSRSVAEVPRWLVSSFALLSSLAFFGLAALGWGDWRTVLAHPARLGAVAAALSGTLVALSSPFNLSSGRREDTGSRWMFLPFLVAFVLFAWLPAYTDRREILTLDGDGVRYLGLALFVTGCGLRVWPMFVLGRRFSGLVAIQEGHELVTDGVYKWIRHPSYLGAVLGIVGWILVFRSGLGLLVLAPFAWILAARVNAEETLLESEFGDAYAAYRRRTWRLLPFIY